MNKLYSIVIALLLSFNFTMFSQTAPPWDFNGTDENFVGSNYSSVTAGIPMLSIPLIRLMMMVMAVLQILI